MAFALGLKPAQIQEAAKFMRALYRAAEARDGSLVEKHPRSTKHLILKMMRRQNTSRRTSRAFNEPSHTRSI